EEELTKGIRTMCDNNYAQLGKIKSSIQNGNIVSLDKALLYVEGTSIYLNRQTNYN
ncbi:uncharacterized protein B0P05DRAFT_464600, partial [Gilbertella persicaria]|uniref:uncharacterized protein n=1 Tax=Gilbertella persicaria TaxID=101096 RepID=UPI0022202AC1